MGSKEKYAVRRLADKIGRELEIDSFESFSLHMNSGGELCVKSAASVRVCTQEEIVLLCRDRILQLKGARLRLLCFSAEETVVSGDIGQICFLREGKDYVG